MVGWELEGGSEEARFTPRQSGRSGSGGEKEDDFRPRRGSVIHVHTHYTSAKHVQLMRPHPTYAEREYTCSRRLRVESQLPVSVSVSVYTLSLSV